MKTLLFPIDIFFFLLFVDIFACNIWNKIHLTSEKGKKFAQFVNGHKSTNTFYHFIYLYPTQTVDISTLSFGILWSYARHGIAEIVNTHHQGWHYQHFHDEDTTELIWVIINTWFELDAHYILKTVRQKHYGATAKIYYKGFSYFPCLKSFQRGQHSWMFFLRQRSLCYYFF